MYKKIGNISLHLRVSLLQSIITKKLIICEQIRVSFLFCRHYTAFREKNQTTEEGPADRSGHTTPDAVKLVRKDIVADEASEIGKKLNSNSNSKHDIINGGKVTIINSVITNALFFVPVFGNKINSR